MGTTSNDTTKKIRYSLADEDCKLKGWWWRSKHGDNVCKNSWNACSSSVFNTFGKINTTAIPQSQTTKDIIFARRLVTIVWYLKANLMAMKRSTLIKARCRIMMALKVRLTVEAKLHNTREVVFPTIMFAIFKTKETVIKISATDKLTRIALDALCRLENLWNAVITRELPKIVTIVKRTWIVMAMALSSLGGPCPGSVRLGISTVVSNSKAWLSVMNFSWIRSYKASFSSED